MIIIIGMVIEVLVFVVVTGADLGKGAVGAPSPPPPPSWDDLRFSDTTGIMPKKTMWFIGVEVEQETTAPHSKKNPWSAPAWWSMMVSDDDGEDGGDMVIMVLVAVVVIWWWCLWWQEPLLWTSDDADNDGDDDSGLTGWWQGLKNMDSRDHWAKSISQW